MWERVLVLLRGEGLRGRAQDQRVAQGAGTREADAVKRLLRDYPLNVWLDAADECPECFHTLRVRVVWLDDDGLFGNVEVHCPECGDSYVDLAGWTLAEEPFSLRGRLFYPIVSISNVGPCLNCWKLIPGAPLILFIDGGRGGELNFCFECAHKLNILEDLKTEE